MKQRELPSTIDAAVALAFQAWGLPAGESTWDRFTPELRERLQSTWTQTNHADPAKVSHDLANAYSQQVSHPLNQRVHLSWWIRALQTESPAVRLAFLRLITPTEFRTHVAKSMEIDPDLVEPDFEPNRPLVESICSHIPGIVLDVPHWPSDSAVVRSLTDLRPYRLYRIVYNCGSIKRLYVKGTDPNYTADPRFLKVAEPDLDAHPMEDRKSIARLGLVTVGRLLTRVDPHRVRWTLQHLPYPIAKIIRAEIEWMNPLPSAWFRGEEKVFQAAHRLVQGDQA